MTLVVSICHGKVSSAATSVEKFPAMASAFACVITQFFYPFN